MNHSGVSHPDTGQQTDHRPVQDVHPEGASTYPGAWFAQDSDLGDQSRQRQKGDRGADPSCHREGVGQHRVEVEQLHRSRLRSEGKQREERQNAGACELQKSLPGERTDRVEDGAGESGSVAGDGHRHPPDDEEAEEHDRGGETARGCQRSDRNEEHVDEPQRARLRVEQAVAEADRRTSLIGLVTHAGKKQHSGREEHQSPHDVEVEIGEDREARTGEVQPSSNLGAGKVARQQQQQRHA